MECSLAPFTIKTNPVYAIKLFFCESNFGTEDDIETIVTRYN